jgi:DNA-binding CsgD family transcriptional regulator
LRLVWNAKSNDTVGTNLRHISAKLDAHSRSEAIARARELGRWPSTHQW